MNKTPNPGSDEALDMGCTCPVLDNRHGKGSYKSEGFIIDMECPIHSSSVQEKECPYAAEGSFWCKCYKHEAPEKGASYKSRAKPAEADTTNISQEKPTIGTSGNDMGYPPTFPPHPDPIGAVLERWRKEFEDDISAIDTIDSDVSSEMESFLTTEIKAAEERGAVRFGVEEVEKWRDAFKDGAAQERARWMNQPANEHDVKIRADERTRVVKIVKELEFETGFDETEYKVLAMAAEASWNRMKDKLLEALLAPNE